jgi:hypothetical protein
LDSMNLFVTARHDRYELACSRRSCALDDDGPVVACLQVLLLLCPLNKPGLSECVLDGCGDSSVFDIDIASIGYM